jgi:hypothetical protein
MKTWNDQGLWCCECPSFSQSDGYVNPGARAARDEMRDWLVSIEGWEGFDIYHPGSSAPPEAPRLLIFVKFSSESSALAYKMRWSE